MDKLAREGVDSLLQLLSRLSRHNVVPALNGALTVSAALQYQVCRQQDHASTARHVGMLPVTGIMHARQSI